MNLFYLILFLTKTLSTSIKYLLTFLGGVAQLVRAPACHAGGREFESRHSRHLFSITSMVYIK